MVSVSFRQTETDQIMSSPATTTTTTITTSSSSSTAATTSTSGGRLQNQVITCRAAVAWHPKEPLSMEEVHVAPPQAGEVRIKITHTSLCHTDVIFWEFDQGIFPCILGHEAVGIVESVGEGVSDVREGDHVIPLYTGECGECEQCRSERTNLCASLKVDVGRGVMRRDGSTRFTHARTGQAIYHFVNVSSFAEYTVLEAGCVAKIQPSVPLDKACLFSCCIPTGVGAVLNTAKVEKGSTVVIFGLGAVGLAVAEGARISGASRIIGVDVNPNKFALGKLFGVTEFINPRDSSEPIENVVKNMTDGGADYCFECVGNIDIILPAFRSTHEGWGRTVVIGVDLKANLLSFHPMEFLFSGREIKGTTFGDYKGKSQLSSLVDMYLNKTLQVDGFITHEMPFENINEAFKLLLEGKSLRSVMTMNVSPI